MLQSSFLKISSILALVILSSQYGLIGSWQLLLQRRYEYINSAVTFQFNRDGDSSGNIVSKLFVYDCFISQFLFQVDQNKISFNFQTSSILTDGCSLDQINQIRSLVKKIFFFKVQFDQLTLLGLNGQPVFKVRRQKIDYSQIMVGVWLIFNSQQTGSFPVRINGSNINLCQGQGQLSYQIKTINGSYPQLSTSLLADSTCKDAFFLNSFTNKLIFQVANNRTQLTFYDRSFKSVFKMNQIGALKANDQLVVISRTTPTRTNANTPSVTDNNNQINLPVHNSQSSNSAPKPIQSNIRTQPLILPTQQYVPQKQQTLNPQPQPQTQTQMQLQSQSQIQIDQTPKQIQVQPLSQTPQIKPQESLRTNQKVVQNEQINLDSMGSFSFDFTASNRFSGSFSSLPLFSNVQSTFSSPSTNSYPKEQTKINPQKDISTDQPSINLSDGFFSGFGSAEALQVQQIQQSQQVQQIQKTQQVGQNNIASKLTINNPVASLNKKGFNQITSIRVPINDFVLSNKWLLVWLNGINNLPESFNRVYLIFTTTKIILYCPCNTFYTDYAIQGNSLKNIKWTGTRNQCEVNRDSIVTNNIFYSNVVRQGDEHLYFWFNSQAKLAQFKPYY